MDAYQAQEQSKLQAEYLKAHPELVQLASQELANWDYGSGSTVYSTDLGSISRFHIDSIGLFIDAADASLSETKTSFIQICNFIP